jgi:GDP-mannose 6-dehydrogenase
MTSAISVFGLGYVGCVSAACFAREGFSVIGVDVSETKVDLINAGTATIVEQGIGELVAAMRASGRLRATRDVCEAVRNSTVSLVCVGTPSRANGNLDLTYVERVCAQIGQALRDVKRRHTIVIRSTVLPGTTHHVAVPAIEQASDLKAGRDFGIAMNPEFLREGSSIRDFDSPPFTVIGADDRDTADVVTELYRGIAAPLRVVDVRVAEMLKYACNSFHGLKVAFANEIGTLCKAAGVDGQEVMRLFCEDTKLNVSAAYLRPGFAFGGSCLPKDLRAVTYRAKQLDVATPVLSATLESNEAHIARSFDLVMASGRKRVGILGLAFKEGTDDLRESPMVALVERLIGKGVQLAIYDREVSDARLIGSNREFIEREVPHIWELMRPTIDDVLASSEVIVIGNATSELHGIEQRLTPGQKVIDLVRAMPARRSDGTTYEGICW